MQAFLIAFELKNPVSLANQEGIAAAIKAAAPYWWHHIPGVWLVAGPGVTPHGLYSALAGKFALQGTSLSDNLLITEIVPKGYQGFLPKNAWDWFELVRAATS